MKDEIIACSKITTISIGKGLTIGIIGLLICLTVLIAVSYQFNSVLSTSNLGAAGHSPMGAWPAILLFIRSDPFAALAGFLAFLSMTWVVIFAYRTTINTAIHKIWKKGGTVKEMMENRIHLMAQWVTSQFDRWDEGVAYAQVKLALLKANARDSDKTWLRRHVARFVIKRLRMEDRELNLSKEDFPYAVNQAVSQFVRERTTTTYWPFVLNMLALLLLLIISLFN